MPYKDPEKLKQYKKYYNEKNKDKIKKQRQNYYDLNKEEQKKYRQGYINTYSGRKSSRISNWKRMGVISDDYNKLYEYYLSIKECENCGIKLEEDYSTRKCLDHNHDTGEFRQVLCHNCNILRR